MPGHGTNQQQRVRLIYTTYVTIKQVTRAVTRIVPRSVLPAIQIC